MQCHQHMKEGGLHVTASAPIESQDSLCHAGIANSTFLCLRSGRWRSIQELAPGSLFRRLATDCAHSKHYILALLCVEVKGCLS